MQLQCVLQDKDNTIRQLCISFIAVFVCLGYLSSNHTSPLSWLKWFRYPLQVSLTVTRSRLWGSADIWVLTEFVKGVLIDYQKTCNLASHLARHSTPHLNSRDMRAIWDNGRLNSSERLYVKYLKVVIRPPPSSQTGVGNLSQLETWGLFGKIQDI